MNINWPNLFTAVILLLASAALLYTVAKARQKRPTMADVFSLIGLCYFVIVYSLSLFPDPAYLIRSGILTRVGQLFLLSAIWLFIRGEQNAT